ncbi:MAG TPA: hypothetical protein VKH37_14185, partial [Ferruginibacter sp.]|nr:hypothetical protein [Ferruginibacter sp.]
EDFFASDFIEEKELPLIKKLFDDNAVKVLPIVVRNCSWEESPWNKIQATPVRPDDGKLIPINNWVKSPDDEDAAWLIVKKQINMLLK